MGFWEGLGYALKSGFLSVVKWFLAYVQNAGAREFVIMAVVVLVLLLVLAAVFLLLYKYESDWQNAVWVFFLWSAFAIFAFITVLWLEFNHWEPLLNILGF